MNIFLIFLIPIFLFSQDELLLENDNINFINDQTDNLLQDSKLFILDEQISSNHYVLGPGDNVVLNIISDESVMFDLFVNPSGELFIPSFGTVVVGGMTFLNAKFKVRQFRFDIKSCSNGKILENLE